MPLPYVVNALCYKESSYWKNVFVQAMKERDMSI